MRVLGKEQYGALVLFQARPEVVGVGLGNSAAFAIVAGSQGRKFLFAAGDDVAVSFSEAVVLARAECFPFALGHSQAGLSNHAHHIVRAGVAVGLHDECQLAQQTRATQAMATAVTGEVGGPVVRAAADR